MQASLVTAVTAGMATAIKKSVTGGVGTTLQMVVVETIPKAKYRKVKNTTWQSEP